MLLLSKRIGEEVVADWCAGLLSGAIRFDDPRRPPIAWIGGAHAVAEVRRSPLEERGQDHWPRTWAARALLYAWRPGRGGEEAVLAGLHDTAWRVREMCARVARRRGLAGAEPILGRLLDDPVLRVRAAAEAALTATARSRE